MGVVAFLIMLVLFFGGIILFSFCYKSFKKKKIILGIVFLIIGIFLITPPTIFIVTATMVTTSIMNR